MREQNLDRFSDYKNTPKSDYYYLVYKPLIRELEAAVKKYAKGKVLDIGCGNKPYEAMFKGLITEYVGCDVVQSSGGKVDVICEATKITLPDASFDTVFSTQAIEHVADHQALVNEAYRLLKPGGHAIISGPMYWHLHEEPYDFFRFTKYGFQHVLEKAGFKMVEIKANGGKWATLGQVILHTLPRRLTKYGFLRSMHNRFFTYLDEKFYNDFNTMNYVVVGKK
jgi:SAM-dependent methyltransferase